MYNILAILSILSKVLHRNSLIDLLKSTKHKVNVKKKISIPNMSWSELDPCSSEKCLEEKIKKKLQKKPKTVITR